VARIDTGSFSEKDIIAKATFDERPSMANKQKRAFAQRVHDFIARENSPSTRTSPAACCKPWNS
jgi:hypothetical protein